MVILTPLPDQDSSSSSPTFDHNYKYDVFLSFRGDDTRSNFIDHLHKALQDANIDTFLDDEGLKTGDELKPELKKAIKESRASIIVLSKDYASSTWCLEELKLILKLHQTSKHVVIPIFYHVEPTDVRKQKNSFGDSFAVHKKTMEAEKDPKRRNELAHRMEEWKKALTEVSNLKGMNANGRKETKFIEEIVRETSSKIDDCLQKEMPFLIGRSSVIRRISSWLRDGSTHTVDMLTIWGLPGIGKTCLAKYIFEMHHDGFERSCFVANIEQSKLFDLQKHLLEKIQKGNLLNMHDADVCAIKIKKALLSKQTFLVLDGIDKFEQLDQLVGTIGFHPGSKIIITTRDGATTEKCGLFYTDILPKHTKHQLTGLDELDSLELLSWHAFQRKNPREGYEEESRKVMKHCVGHPLALEILGSSLRNKDVLAWKETIELLEEGFRPQIQNILQISFHSLPSDNEKELFKHIACFFVGKNKEFTEVILKGCGFKTQLGFSTLIDRCLVTIGLKKELMMHQLLQEFGRDLVRQESPKNPGERSRLWNHVESYDVLKQEKATEKIQGLVLDMKIVESDNLCGMTGSSTKEKFKNEVHEEFGVRALLHRVCSFFLRIWCLFAWFFQLPSSRRDTQDLKANALSKMEKIMLLQLNYVQLHGSYKRFPKDLRWLCMHGFTLSYIPWDIQMDKMVALDMSYSNLRQLWKKPKLLPSLKILNLTSSKLVSTGDLSGLPALERLILARCVSLIEVSESIGQCIKLICLDLSYCGKLKRLPQSTQKLKSVRTLSIRGCISFKKFPSEIKEMKSLQEMDASDIITNCQLVLPKSIKSSLILFPCSIVSLSLRNNKLTNESFPIDFSSMSKLKVLDLSRNPITSLPMFVRSLQKLAFLCLESCSSLMYLSCLPSTIVFLDANNCPLLEKITIHPEMISRPMIGFRSSESLTEIEGIRKIQPLKQMEVEILHSLGWDDIEQVKDQQLKVFDIVGWDKPKELLVQMARRGRGAAAAAAAELPPQPPHTDHAWLRFPTTLSARLLRSYRTELARLASRIIEVPHTLDWAVADDAQFSQQLIDLLTQTFTDESGVTLFTCHGWSRIFHISEPVYRELVLEFFSTYSFRETSVDYDDRTAISFRLGGVSREMSLREFSWRVGIYTRQETTGIHFLPFLRVCMRGPPLEFREAEYWQTIANGVYLPETAVERMIRHPLHRLIHRLLSSSISHRRGGEKVPALDLYYLWSILTPGIYCNIPYSLALYLSAKAKGPRHNSPICGGHFITRLATSFGILTDIIERGLMRLEPRPMGVFALETMQIVERDIAGTRLVAADLAEQGEYAEQPQRQRRRRRSPAQPAETMPTLQDVSRSLDDLTRAHAATQAAVGWMTTELSFFFQHQGYRPFAPPPTLFTPPPQDIPSTSRPHGDDDEDDSE